jgi:hypothetical protein
VEQFEHTHHDFVILNLYAEVKFPQSKVVNFVEERKDDVST